jgi:hypothetical protein
MENVSWHAYEINELKERHFSAHQWLVLSQDQVHSMTNCQKYYFLASIISVGFRSNLNENHDAYCGSQGVLNLTWYLYLEVIWKWIGDNTLEAATKILVRNYTFDISLSFYLMILKYTLTHAQTHKHMRT